jgi:hypothetical protein
MLTAVTNIEEVCHRRHISPTPSDWSFGANSGVLTAASGPPGQSDTNWRFRSFQRRYISPEASVVASSSAAGELTARGLAHAGPRREQLNRNTNRNGYNPITGEDRGADIPEVDTFRPRRQGPGVVATRRDVREVPQLMFHGPPDQDSAAIRRRKVLLVEEGLVGLADRRSSSVLGYGRTEMPSMGAADAFGASIYGGMRYAVAEGKAPEDSNLGVLAVGVPVDVWDVQTILEDPERLARRLAAVSRAPNRIFDTTSYPVILASHADPAKRAAREAKEAMSRDGATFAASRGNFSFTARADGAAVGRARASKQSEVNMVASLRL